MRFDDPALFALCALVVPLIWLLRREARLERPRYLLPQLFGAPPLADEASRRLRALPFLGVLRLLALVLIVIAAARPQATTVEAVKPAEGIDIVLVIDASSSMATARLSDDETRMSAARRVARDFVAERRANGNDRIGLVMFQRRALVLSPLTLDLDAIDEMVEVSVRSGLIPDGTGLGVATMEAIDLLRGSDAASRIVVVLTDGENNVPDITPNQSAAVARATGVRLYTIGLPSNVQQVGVGFNELTLIYMADETGGVYFRATDAGELAAAYESISELERERVGEEIFLTTEELAPWFLLAAGLLVVLEIGLRSTWWRRTP
jgi:Ca-activated chloride channel family protein